LTLALHYIPLFGFLLAFIWLAAVEACVSHGLKRRALGLFKSSSTTALLHKIAKAFQPAANVVQLIAEVENCDPNK